MPCGRIRLFLRWQPSTSIQPISATSQKGVFVEHVAILYGGIYPGHSRLGAYFVSSSRRRTIVQKVQSNHQLCILCNATVMSYRRASAVPRSESFETIPAPHQFGEYVLWRPQKTSRPFCCGKVMIGEPSRIRTQPRSICIMTGSSLDPMQYSWFETHTKA